MRQRCAFSLLPVIINSEKSLFIEDYKEPFQVRLQTQEAGKKLYKGTWSCFSKILKEEGVRGLYKGKW